jgi:hypothetical protein
MSKNSIWFMAGGGGCDCFDLRGKLLQVLEKLAGGKIGEHNPSGYHPVRLRGIFPDGLIKPDACECDGYVAVYGADTYHLACE